MVDVIRSDDHPCEDGGDRADGGGGAEVAEGSSTSRARQRLALAREIKEVARRHLAPRRGGSLSVRAVARDVGIVPSGIYRYYASRDDLVAAVAEDVTADAAAALASALEEAGSKTYFDQALAMATAHRRWCVEQRTDFALLLGPDLGGERGLLDLERLTALLAAPLRHYAEGLDAGLVEGRRAPQPGAEGTTRPAPEDRDRVLRGWLQLSGLVWVELFGPLADLHADPEEAWRAQARATLREIGYCEPVSTPGRPARRTPARS